MIGAFRRISRDPDVNMLVSTRRESAFHQGAARLIRRLRFFRDRAQPELDRGAEHGHLRRSVAPGDEVVVSDWDYPISLGGWQQRASREGIRVVRARFDPLDDDDAIVRAYAAALTPRTRVMQLTHMLHG